MYHEIMINDAVNIMEGAGLRSYELIRNVSLHSKTTKPGDIFFALKGERTDGHRFVQEAVMNGACAAVVERQTSSGNDIIVHDTLYALGQLARYYRCIFAPTTVAITGTNGKTTVKNLVAAILSRRNTVTHSMKNYNSLIGLPLTLFELTGSEQYLVVEMGTNAPGEIARLCEIAQPHIGVITTVGPGHLQGLGSVNGVRKEKGALLEALPDDGFAVVGDAAGSIEGKHITRFSLEQCTDIEIKETGSCFTYLGKRFSTPLLGVGNVYNCCAALCLTTLLGCDYSAQRDALACARPEPGRLEPLYSRELLIIDDSYNANPVSMKAAFMLMSEFKRRSIYVLGDMLELGVDATRLHREIGSYARDRCDMLFTCGEQAQSYGGQHFPDKTALVKHLLSVLRDTDVVLIKASHGLHFETIVSELLRRR
jgi:UDP-N-acetylmuramoyl-tripeptide--D-alanyl-D-alanine ligase